MLHSVTIVIRFAGGALATDHVAWMREDAHPLGQCARSRMVLMGDKGAFEIDLNARPAALLTEKHHRMCDTVILGGRSYYGCLKLQFEGFLRSIENGEPVLAPVDEALNAQRLVAAAAESLAKDAVVTL
jgi:predicted dehydrogenase